VFDVEHPSSLNTREALIREVHTGLRRRPRSLSPWMFSDRYGSRLFERITQLPEYYPTRTDLNILASLADAIVALARTDKRRSVRLLELGAGTPAKTCILLMPSEAFKADERGWYAVTLASTG
ncbi:MAG: L-histidine N(alpha)-methyltransferase, partial [Acidobacteriia bacterium]|nr:L-histidine N(alpha)-methyltransferase [Terriglobia bacterium]